MAMLPLLSTSAAAFIAGLSDRQMNRVVDERLVPDALFDQTGGTRAFTRLGAAFASFYFGTEDLLVAGARRQVLEELAERVRESGAKHDVLALRTPDAVSWKVERQAVAVDVTPFVHRASLRAQEIAVAAALVHTDPDILGGTPVFAGSRLPIEVVTASLAAGVDLERLQASYPFLTPAHVLAAQVHERLYRRRGRPRRLADDNPDLAPRRVTRIDKRAAAA